MEISLSNLILANESVVESYLKRREGEEEKKKEPRPTFFRFAL